MVSIVNYTTGNKLLEQKSPAHSRDFCSAATFERKLNTLSIPMPAQPLHIRTPLFEHITLSNLLGKRILLKMECYQPVGSFKIRGVGFLCQKAVERGVTHLISSSGGNAGYAVAYAGKKLGCKVTVVVPQTTPADIQEKIQVMGAEVIVHGRVWDESHDFACGMAEQDNTCYVSPFDHPDIWKGHATIIDEIAAAGEEPDALVLSVGGGGLLCGVLEGLHRNGWHHIPVIAVETEGAASFAQSITAGRLITLPDITSVAISLGAKRVAETAFEWSKRHRIQPTTVSDRAAVNACLRFADDQRVLVEPACGAALSIVYDESEIIKEMRTVLVIVCGGIGVNLGKLSRWKADFTLR